MRGPSGNCRAMPPLWRTNQRGACRRRVSSFSADQGCFPSDGSINSRLARLYQNPSPANAVAAGGHLPLLRDIIETYPNLQSARANITLEFDRLLLLGNESAFTQVFSNLLGNAVKFVAPGVSPASASGLNSAGFRQAPRLWHPIRRRELAPRLDPSFEFGLRTTALVLQTRAGKDFPHVPAHASRDEYPGTGIGLAGCEQSP